MPATFQSGPYTLHRNAVEVAGTRRAGLVFLHGYDDYGARYADGFEAFAERGIESHWFDFRGHGRSQGRRGFVRRWDEFLEDLDAFLKADPDAVGAPVFFAGHSHGALVLAAAILRGRLPESAGALLLSPFFESALNTPAWKLLLARVASAVRPSLFIPSGLDPEWLSSDPAQADDARRDPLRFGTATARWYVSTLNAQREITDRAGEFAAPFLMLLGEDDRIASVNANKTFFEQTASKDRSLHVYPEMRHELLRERDRRKIFCEIADWILARV